jgi:hypothetical protein
MPVTNNNSLLVNGRLGEGRRFQITQFYVPDREYYTREFGTL